jgi:hypothetical protein
MNKAGVANTVICSNPTNRNTAWLAPKLLRRALVSTEVSRTIFSLSDRISQIAEFAHRGQTIASLLP